MFLGIITLISALVISSIVGYFSVIGLAALFAGAFWSVILMAGALEVSKVILAAFLYRNFKILPLWMKIYFPISLILLVFITSAGVYGYLSKSHLEFHEPAVEMEFEINEIEAEISALSQKRKGFETELRRLEQSKEDAYENVQQRKQALEIRKNPIQQRITRLEGKIERLESDKQKLREQRQGMLDNYAEREANRIITATKELRKQEQPIMDKIAADIDAKDAEIEAIYSEMDAETKALDAINAEIVALAPDTGTLDDKIRQAEDEITAVPNQEKQLVLKKNAIENKIATHKADLGPLVYVAELIWGKDAESNTDRAVRYLIVIFVVILDPLALSMLVASNVIFHRIIENNKNSPRMRKLAAQLAEKQETDDLPPADRPPEPLVHELVALRDELKTALDGMVRVPLPAPAVIDEDIDDAIDEPVAETPDEILDFADEAADDDRHDDHRFISDRQREHAADDPGRVLEALLEQRRRGDTRPRPAEPDADPEMMTQAQFDVLTQHMDAAETEQAYGRLSAAERNRITLWRSTGISKIKGKLGHAKKIHNEEQMRRVQESGADINNVEYLDDATEQ